MAKGDISGSKLYLKPNGYKAGLLMSEQPTDGTGDFTFARASKKNRINSDLKLESINNDVPPLSYDGSCPYLDREPQSTNLLKYPLTLSDFTQSGTTLDNNGGTGYTAPSVDYPSGALKLVEDTSTGSHFNNRYFTIVTAGSFVSYSIYVKKSENNYIRIELNDNATGTISAIADILNGTISNDTSSGEWTNYSSNIESVSNGYYRISISGKLGSTRTNVVSYNSLVDNDGITTSYTGDGVSGVYIAFPQLEELYYASSWIFNGTEGSTSLRLADVVTPLSITQNTQGAIIRDGYVQQYSTNTPSKIIINSKASKLILKDAQLTASEITLGGYTEAVFITDLTATGEFEITISGTGTIYWGDGESDAYSGNNVVIKHTYTKLPYAIKFVGTLTNFQTYTSGTNCTHDLSSLPVGLITYYNIANETTGDINDLPISLTYYENRGSNHVNTYTSGHLFSSSITTFIHLPTSGYGLTTTMIDNLLINLSSTLTAGGTITLNGNNAARSSASDAAVTTLIGNGYTVTTN